MNLIFSAQEGAIQKLADEIEQEFKKAMAGAVKDAADEAVEKGRDNIAGAGFSDRWQKGFMAKFYDNDGINPAALIYHRRGLARVFEEGRAIAGRPLLWLPVGGRRARGRLVSVNVPGKPPMMFDKYNREAGPVLIGIRGVSIGRRFKLMQIIEEAAERMGEYFQKRMKG